MNQDPYWLSDDKEIDNIRKLAADSIDFCAKNTVNVAQRDGHLAIATSLLYVGDVLRAGFDAVAGALRALDRGDR